MEFVAGYIVLAVIPALIANSKRLSFGKYFVISLLFWPVGLVLAILAKPNTRSLEEHEIDAGERVRCPSCAELIRPEAKVCRYCSTPTSVTTRLEVGGVVIRE